MQAIADAEQIQSCEFTTREEPPEMCISHSVGVRGVNNGIDVKLVQILLNENLGRLIPFAPLAIDGRIGKNTLDMIAEFQRRVLRTPKPDGKVDPGGGTLRELRAGMTAQLTPDKLQGIMLHANAALINRYFQPLVTMMANNQVNTPMRMAHFLAQIGHESGDLRYNEELADGSAYEGRADLGNTQPGDGPRFKGRGLIQLTGRANYVAYGTARSRDFVTGTNNTLIATDPNLAVDVACWYWTTNGLNALAGADDVNGITLAINGGYNGLADRKAHLQRAKCLLVR
jgi:putative chitinase